MDRTLILVKPDAFARGLTGEIIARFERKGLKIVALKHMTVTEELAKPHYAEHDGKPFFGELVEFITSGPLVAMVLEGDEAIRAARQVIGATNPLEATTGSIRGDFAVAVGQNMVHGSDSRSRAGARRAVLPRRRLTPVLASASPQRRAILERRGDRLRGAPRRRRRADRGRSGRGRRGERPPQGDWRWPATLVLGADTIVVLDGEILGKPRDAAQAREFVGRLNGRTHEVVGGIALAAWRRGGRHGGRDDAGDFHAPATRRSTATWHRGVGGPRRRLRDPGRRRLAGRLRRR